MRTLVVFALALCGVACRGIAELPQTGVRLETAHAVVHARTRSEAEHLEQHVARLAPQLSAWLGTNAPRPVIAVLEEEPAPGASGLTGSDRILLHAQPSPRVDEVLTHELLHWFARGAWSRLPNALEEGLAEVIVARVHGPATVAGLVGLEDVFREPPSRTRLHRVLGDPANGSRLVSRAFEAEMRHRAIGFALAHAIGVDGLRRLVERASDSEADRVFPHEVLAAVPFDLDDPRAWRALVLESLGPGFASATDVQRGWRVTRYDEQGRWLDTRDQVVAKLRTSAASTEMRAVLLPVP